MKMNTSIVFLILLFNNLVAQEKVERTFFDSGKLKRERSTVNNLRKTVNYYESGQVHSERIYNAKYRTISEKAYDEDGTLLMEITNISPPNQSKIDIVHFQLFHLNGKLKQEGSFKYDSQVYGTYLPFDEWKTYTPDNALIEEITYDWKQSKTIGFLKGATYFKNGNIKSKLFFDAKEYRFGYESYYPNNKKYIKAVFSFDAVNEFDNANKNTLEVLRDVNAVFRFVHFDEAVNYIKAYYPNEQLMRISENATTKYFDKLGNPVFPNTKPKDLPEHIECYVDAKNINEDCAWVRRKGERKDGNYWLLEDDRGTLTSIKGKDFLYKEYFLGMLKQETHMIDGKKNGVSKLWDVQTGQLLYDETYKDDMKDGTYKQYDVFGELEEFSNYVDGNRSGETMIWGAGAHGKGKQVNDEWEGEVVWYDNDTGFISFTENYVKGRKEGKHKKYHFDFSYYPPPAIDYGVIFEYYENGVKVKETYW